jgi:hypothetical protein
VSENKSVFRLQNTQQQQQQQQQPSRNLQDSTPYASGTPVYWQFPNEGWWKGLITNYNADTGMYTIQWEDGSMDYYDDLETVDQMVAYAQNDPQTTTAATTAGTAAATVAPTEDVTEDATEEDTEDVTEDVTEQVAAGQLWDLGTPVAEYEEGQWWYGTITSYSDADGYSVTWDDDGEVETFTDYTLVNQMVSDGEPTETVAPTDEDTEEDTEEDTDVRDQGNKYAVGQSVYKEFDDGWWVGVVEATHRHYYAVRWSDGSLETYAEGPEMDQMVAAAANIPSTSGGGMSGAGKFLLSFSVLIVVGLVAVVGVRYHRKKVAAKRQAEKNLSLEEPREDVVTYRDEPSDDTPKII